MDEQQSRGKLVMVFLLWVAWIFGTVLADKSAAQAAASRGAEASDVRSMPGLTGTSRPAPPFSRQTS
jgi:hypothetical protein